MVVSGGPVKFGVAVVVLAAAAWATAWAQGLGPSTSGSLTELTAEVRQLRMVVQDAGRNQVQIQALNISLTAQQGRLTQVSARLDKVEDELAIAWGQAQEAAREFTSAQTNLAAASTEAERRHFQGLVAVTKGLAERHADEENRVRTRQAELLAMFRTEEARWLELVAKLDEIMKR